MGDHTESLQVDFDPAAIGFEEIAKRFWSMHNPCAAPYSRQYMSAIWYHDQEQKSVLEKFESEVRNRSGDKNVQTPVLAFEVFHLAEDYHQKYWLQSRRKLMDYFSSVYSEFVDFNNSTAAARLNGFVHGNGSQELFESETDTYGIPHSDLVRLFS